MNVVRAIVILAVASLVTGCMTRGMERKLAGQIDVFGVELYSEVDYRELNGIAAEEEPCLRGYERSFAPLDIVIGYGFDKKIRKITTHNPQTGMFGIKPGIALEEGKKLVRQAGFDDDAAPFTFRSGDYSLRFFVDGDDAIFGMKLEVVE